MQTEVINSVQFLKVRCHTETIGVLFRPKQCPAYRYPFYSCIVARQKYRKLRTGHDVKWRALDFTLLLHSALKFLDLPQQ
jgi:hypothetical protein